MQRTQRDLLLGLVFFLGLGLLLWATFNLGSISVRKAERLEARFPNASGLRDGDAVQVLGRKTGQVLSVRYDPEGGETRIVVTFQLDDLMSLRADAQIAIKDSGLLGGKSIDIEPGKAAKELDLTKPWLGTTSRAPFDSISETFAGDDNKANLAGALKSLRELLENLNNPKTSIGAMVRERDLYNNLLDASGSIARIFQAIDSGEGAFGALLRDKDLANDARNIVAGVKFMVQTINEGKSPLGRIVHDQDAGKALVDTVADAREIVRGVRAGEGALGAVLRDPEMASQLRAIVAGAESVMTKINDPGAGPVGALLGSLDWRDRVGKFLENIAAISEGLRSGNGLLARLINDRDLGERFDRIFIQVSRALEDAREAAPVGTIIQVLSGVF